ncbi:MAG: hypothetical protein COZ11_04970 [Deltaproteobacteria bacterium CG_4_10_14_3_um_filter_51_14]|nr:MAG: hypothetical protein COZ11_04970 [Deltaproteobacteria bacterium CG_4_10_14_3_um_filter_51_14]
MVMPGQGTTKDENGACQKPTRSGIQVGISAKAGTMTGCLSRIEVRDRLRRHDGDEGRWKR